MTNLILSIVSVFVTLAATIIAVGKGLRSTVRVNRLESKLLIAVAILFASLSAYLQYDNYLSSKLSTDRISQLTSTNMILNRYIKGSQEQPIVSFTIPYTNTRHKWVVFHVKNSSSYPVKNVKLITLDTNKVEQYEKPFGDMTPGQNEVFIQPIGTSDDIAIKYILKWGDGLFANYAFAGVIANDGKIYWSYNNKDKHVRFPDHMVRLSRTKLGNDSLRKIALERMFEAQFLSNLAKLHSLEAKLEKDSTLWNSLDDVDISNVINYIRKKQHLKSK